MGYWEGIPPFKSGDDLSRCEYWSNTDAQL